MEAVQIGTVAYMAAVNRCVEVVKGGICMPRAMLSMRNTQCKTCTSRKLAYNSIVPCGMQINYFGGTGKSPCGSKN